MKKIIATTLLAVVFAVANAGLRSVAWFFDCGDDDHLLPLSCEIHSLMSKAGIKNELRVRDGIHNWEYWHNALRLSPLRLKELQVELPG